MAVTAVPNKVIYIGGIPFDQTEEQVLEIARTVGPVQQIQLIFDKETGKSKGYGFVKYYDEETAVSAVRNLSTYTIGNRTLKCSYSNEGAMADPFGNLQQQVPLSQDLQQQQRTNKTQRKKQTIPPLPPGIDVHNEKPGDAITRELQRIDQARLSNIIKDSIKMAKTNPKLMEELLIKNPQLSYAIVQASLMVNAISEQDLASLVKDIPDSIVEQEVVEQQLTEEQKLLIKQVISLTDLEVASLPDDQKKIVYQLKGQYLGVM